MPLTPQAAHTRLMNNPGAFLKKHPIKIAGNPGPSGVSGYNLYDRGGSQRPGARLGTHHWHNTQAFNLRSGAVGNPLAGPAAHNFQAHSIHMDLNIVALGFYQLPAVGGPSIMVTGQLSGCSFIIVPTHGGNLDVAHVKPAVGGGANLRTALEALHPAPAFVYGVRNAHGYYRGYDREAAIIGVRIAGAWQIYAQKQEPTSNSRIRSLWQIYPEHIKM